MNAKAETKSIHAEYDLPHSPAKVWRALTEPELLAMWLMPNDIRPVVGQVFSFKAAPMPGWDGTVACEVLASEPPKRLQYSWRGGPAASHLDSVVTWTLTPTASGGTLLVLEHSGFLPINAFAFDAMSKGWRGKVAERVNEALARLT